MKKIVLVLIIYCPLFVIAQDVTVLVQKVNDTLEQVTDYEASGKMKTNVIFLKVPVATVKV